MRHIQGDTFILNKLELIRPLLSIFYILIVLVSKFKKIKASNILIHRDENISQKKLICIFCNYQLRPDSQRLIIELKKEGYYVIEVINRSDININIDAHNGNTLISKSNFTRDFGAYSAGYFYIKKNAGKVQKVLFLNDSLLYFGNGQNIINFFKFSKSDYSGITESIGSTYFINSFCFQISSKILKEKKIQSFFKNLNPTNSPKYAVSKAEKRLSKILITKLKSTTDVYIPTQPFLASDKQLTKKLLYKYYIFEQIRRSSANRLFNFMLEKDFEKNLYKRSIDKSVQEKYLKDISLINHFPLELVEQYKFPFIKLNTLSRGFVTFSELNSLELDEDIRKNIIENLMNNYISYYSQPNPVIRIFSFAKLWSYI